MKPTCDIAYKEWASVTEALARGTYVMSLRKGGIHEKRGEFSVEHREFFLFPTYLHQRESDLVPGVVPLLEETRRAALPEGQIPIRYYVTVEDARYIENLDAILALDGLHPFTRAGVEMRFNYKKPGLWAIVQRVYRLPEACVIPDERVYAGCRSWVPLKEALSTSGAAAVLEDAAFAAKLEEIKNAKRKT
ncbi:MAG: DUF1802 family protein [Planctomycetota bacterium]|nr:DUF1802 family protein [Planctomycetota bacterium]